MINVNQPDAELDDLFARAEAEEAEEAAWEAAMRIRRAMNKEEAQ